MISITLIQTSLYWEDVKKNLDHFDKLLKKVKETDLIILPETFNTGFSMKSKILAEPINGQTMDWIRSKAKEKNAVICGSLIIYDNQRQYNRLIWMKPDGEYEFYNKRHLFRMGDEGQNFTPGNSRLIVELKGWKICPQICYDLRFPVWSRNQFETDRLNFATAEYDLLIYIANWPKVRVDTWEKLLYARAIENQTFVAAVNRVGVDGLGIEYSGNSMVVDAKGGERWKAKNDKEEVKTFRLDKTELDGFRKKFPVGMDADQFNIE